MMLVRPDTLFPSLSALETGGFSSCTNSMRFHWAWTPSSASWWRKRAIQFDPYESIINSDRSGTTSCFQEAATDCEWWCAKCWLGSSTLL